MATLDDLVNALQVSDADRNAAQKQFLLNTGIGLLGVRRGDELGGLGRALQGGLLGQQNYLQQQRDNRLRDLQARGMAINIANQQDAYNQTQAYRQAIAGYRPPTPMSMAMSAAPSLSPTVGNVAAVTQQAATIPAPGVYERLLQQADYLDSKKLPERAQEYRLLAEKYAPQYDGTETLMQNGKPAVVQKFKNRPATTLDGYQPKPDFKQVDAGGRVGFVDPLLNLQGPSFDKTMTPNEAAMLPIHQGELAVAQGNLGVNRGRLSLEQSNAARTAAQEAQGQIVPTPDGMFLVDKRAGTGRPIMGPDGKPLTQAEKPLTESQAKATVFANQMLAASNKLSDLEGKGFSGTGRAQQLVNSLAATEGIPYTPVASIAHMFAPQKAQEYTQAARQWTEGFLRFQSGATITPAELDAAFKTYFPQPMDGPAVVKQKKEMRRQAEENMRAAAGSGSSKFLPRDQPAAPGGLSQSAIEAEMRRRGLLK